MDAQNCVVLRAGRILIGSMSGAVYGDDGVRLACAEVKPDIGMHTTNLGKKSHQKRERNNTLVLWGLASVREP